jgi:hypothetical protein
LRFAPPERSRKVEVKARDDRSFAECRRNMQRILGIAAISA